VLSIKLIYLKLLIFHFIRPVESAELPNAARVSKSLETPDIHHVKKMFEIRAVDLSELYVICCCIRLPISEKKQSLISAVMKVEVIIVLKWAKIKFV
jgi:hypothetical protein